MSLFTKFKQQSSLGITVLIIIGILAVVNFFSYQIFFRADLTANNDYSISKVSKNAVSKLDDVVNIKAYFSKDLPSQYITLRQEVGDILDEYEAYSNGKIRVEFIDPVDDDEMKQEIYMLGIPELQFNVLEKDKYEIVKGYLGIAVQYGGKTEAIPVIENTQNLEYQVTLAIKKITTDDMAVVGFLTSNSTLDLENEASVAYQKLQEIYQVRKVDLIEESSVPDDIDTLIILGPKSDFSEDQLKAIDEFLIRGKSLLVATDGINMGEGLVAEPNNTGLNKILENYGVRINNDLVLDVSNGMAAFTQGFITFNTNYPFWPKVIEEGFDQGNATVSGLESLIMPWVSSLDVVDSNINENNKISYLAQTTEKSWRQTENFDLNPQQLFQPTGEQKRRTLAISVFGNERLIVVGDSDFIKDNFLRNMPDNLVFFQNLVDSLSLDEDLISIRSQGVSDRPIKELSDGAKMAIRYFNVFGLTIIIMAFGMFRYYMRKKSRFVDDL
ncbi:MAG: GldG family protein [Candidatus Falkowbacteria bacterium]